MPYKDPEKRKEYLKQYREANSEKLKDYQRRRYGFRGSTPQDNARSAAWQKANKDKVKVIKQRFYDRKVEWLTSFYGADKLHCERCRYDKSFVALVCHHLDPSQKEHSKDNLGTWLKEMSLERFQNKILNTDFIFLCANCHIELHYGLWTYG